MRTIRTKVYHFSELCKAAKENATQINAYDCEFFDAHDFLESLKKFAEHFNCELKDYDIDWSNSVFCFIDPINGDIYKPACWNAPAKGVRSNIHSVNPPLNSGALYR